MKVTKKWNQEGPRKRKRWLCMGYNIFNEICHEMISNSVGDILEYTVRYRETVWRSKTLPHCAQRVAAPYSTPRWKSINNVTHLAFLDQKIHKNPIVFLAMRHGRGIMWRSDHLRMSLAVIFKRGSTCMWKPCPSTSHRIPDTTPVSGVLISVSSLSWSLLRLFCFESFQPCAVFYSTYVKLLEGMVKFHNYTVKLGPN